MNPAPGSAFYEPQLAAMPQLREKPRQGFETWKTAWKPGPNVANSTAAIGMRAALVLEGVRKTYRARYYNPTTGRFLSEDPMGFAGSGPNFYAYAGDNPSNSTDPLGLKNYNEQQTLEWLNQAYISATAGPIQGLTNMLNNSTGMLNPDTGQLSGRVGQFDFAYTQYMNDTWTFNGQTMDASHFANFVAGFEGAAYDATYFPDAYLLGIRPAEKAMQDGGIAYHLSGHTLAKHDPFDLTGMPDILNGENSLWIFYFKMMRNMLLGRPNCH